MVCGLHDVDMRVRKEWEEVNTCRHILVCWLFISRVGTININRLINLQPFLGKPYNLRTSRESIQTMIPSCICKHVPPNLFLNFPILYLHLSKRVPSTSRTLTCYFRSGCNSMWILKKLTSSIKDNYQNKISSKNTIFQLFILLFSMYSVKLPTQRYTSLLLQIIWYT